MKRTVWLGIKKQGKLVLDNRELLNEFIKSIPEEHRFQIVLEDIPKPKSQKQNSTYWMVIDRAIYEMEDLGIDTSYIYGNSVPTGVPVTKDCLHQFFYAIFPQTDERGKRITMSDSKWTSKHEAKMIDAVINWLASQLGIVVQING